MPFSRFQIPLVIVPLMFMGCDDADIETPAPSEPEEPFVSSFDVHVAGAVDEILIEDLEPEPSPPASKLSPSSPTEPAKPAVRAPKEKTAKKNRTIGPRRPTLGRAAPKTQGRTQADIRNTIRTSLPQVRACYERELKTRPNLEGKVVAQWTIDPGGGVRSPKVRSNTTASAGLASCITRAVKEWRFASAAHSSDVEYPFTFKPRETW